MAYWSKFIPEGPAVQYTSCSQIEFIYTFLQLKKMLVALLVFFYVFAKLATENSSQAEKLVKNIFSVFSNQAAAVYLSVYFLQVSLHLSAWQRRKSFMSFILSSLLHMKLTECIGCSVFIRHVNTLERLYMVSWNWVFYFMCYLSFFWISDYYLILCSSLTVSSNGISRGCKCMAMQCWFLCHGQRRLGCSAEAVVMLQWYC